VLRDSRRLADQQRRLVGDLGARALSRVMFQAIAAASAGPSAYAASIARLNFALSSCVRVLCYGCWTSRVACVAGS